MSTPASRWARTTSITAWRTRASKAPASGTVPVSSASSRTVRSSGRGRLPVCVVRMRSVLAFMAPYDSTWVVASLKYLGNLRGRGFPDEHWVTLAVLAFETVPAPTNDGEITHGLGLGKGHRRDHGDRDMYNGLSYVSP